VREKNPGGALPSQVLRGEGRGEVVTKGGENFYYISGLESFKRVRRDSRKRDELRGGVAASFKRNDQENNKFSRPVLRGWL